jgi:hypothetical protein
MVSGSRKMAITTFIKNVSPIGLFPTGFRSFLQPEIFASTPGGVA